MTHEEMLKVLQERGAVSNAPISPPASSPYCKWLHDTVRVKSRGDTTDLEASSFLAGLGSVIFGGFTMLALYHCDYFMAVVLPVVWILTLIPAHHFWLSDTVCLRCGKVDLRYSKVQQKKQAKEDRELKRRGQAEAIYRQAQATQDKHAV